MSVAVLCGVPQANCCGTMLSVGKMGTKIHMSHKEAFNCHRKHLLSLGYKQYGPREMEAPAHLGGRIRVLTKKSRFGAVLKPGKTGEGGTTGGGSKRFNHKAGGGSIISM